MHWQALLSAIQPLMLSMSAGCVALVLYAHPPAGEGVSRELVDRIPGKQTDRKTAMGELNWIFTAITDTIAWNVLPRPLFQRLFRQVCHPIL